MLYIGLEETGKLKITTLATISIAILVYFQYLHEHFMNTLEVNRQTYFFGEAEKTAEIYVDYKKLTWFSRICNTTHKILNVHFNKLEVMLVAFSIMYKVSLRLSRDGQTFFSADAPSNFSYKRIVQTILHTSINHFIFELNFYLKLIILMTRSMFSTDSEKRKRFSIRQHFFFFIFLFPDNFARSQSNLMFSLVY